MVLRPLPYDRPEQLVRVYTESAGGHAVPRRVARCLAPSTSISARHAGRAPRSRDTRRWSAALAGGDHIRWRRASLARLHHAAAHDLHLRSSAAGTTPARTAPARTDRRRALPRAVAARVRRRSRDRRPHDPCSTPARSRHPRDAARLRLPLPASRRGSRLARIRRTPRAPSTTSRRRSPLQPRATIDALDASSSPRWSPAGAALRIERSAYRRRVTRSYARRSQADIVKSARDPVVAVAGACCSCW